MRISDWSSDVCSSDLSGGVVKDRGEHHVVFDAEHLGRHVGELLRDCAEDVPVASGFPGRVYSRSEEHTSELQSLMRISYAVFCLKNKNNNTVELIYMYYHKYDNHTITINTLNKSMNTRITPQV